MNKKISSLYKKVRDGTATYLEANRFAVEVGNILAKSYRLNLDVESMDYETALKLLTGPLTNNYELITKYCDTVQDNAYKKQKMNLRPVKPKINHDRIDGLAKAVSEAHDALSGINYFGEQIINFSQSIVDESIKSNAGFASDLGYYAYIIREYEGPHDERGETVDCEWCQSLAGTYDYEDVKSGGSEVFMRHEGCRCTLTYITKKGSTMLSGNRNAFTRF